MLYVVLFTNLYSMKEHGGRHFVFLISISLVMSVLILLLSFPYISSNVQLSQMGNPSTLNFLQGGWQPTRFITYSSAQRPKLYWGEGSHGLWAWLSFSCLIGWKIPNVTWTWFWFYTAMSNNFIYVCRPLCRSADDSLPMLSLLLALYLGSNCKTLI